MGGLNLSGFARGLASTDPVGFYMKTKEHELRKRQADNAQQEFEWRKEEQDNKRQYADSAAAGLGKIGTDQYDQANTNNVDDGVASTDRPEYRGVPTQYTRANYFKDLAPVAAKVNPALGLEFMDKQREEEKKDEHNKFFGALERYKQTGDASDLAGVFNGFAGVYNKDKRFQDGKFAAFSAVPAGEGNAGPEGIPLASAGTPQAKQHTGLALSILDTNSGKNSQHFLGSDEEIMGAYYKAMAAKYPEEVARYAEYMDKQKARAMQDRTIQSGERRADAAEKNAETAAEHQRSQDMFYRGRLLNDERRIAAAEKAALAASNARAGKEALGWHGMDLKERSEFMKDNQGAWSLPTGNGDGTYFEHPQGRALFSKLANVGGAEGALDIMARANADIRRKATLIPGAVDEKTGAVSATALQQAADFVYADALSKIRNGAPQQPQQNGRGTGVPAKADKPAPKANNFPPDSRVRVVNGMLVNPNGVKEAPPQADISPTGLQKRLGKTDIGSDEASLATKYLR